MAWDKCLVHAIFSVGGYIFFGVAAMGSIMHLSLQKYGSSGKAGNYFEQVTRLRHRMDCAYLVIGFVLSLFGFVLGLLQAKNTWGSFLADAKTISSASVILYYLILIGVMAALSAKKSERVKQTISTMAIIGGILLFFNVILVNFLLPTVHRYL